MFGELQTFSASSKLASSGQSQFLDHCLKYLSGTKEREYMKIEKILLSEKATGPERERDVPVLIIEHDGHICGD